MSWLNLGLPPILWLPPLFLSHALIPDVSSAQQIKALGGLAAVSDYMQQQDIDTFRAWQSRNQVTSFNQFSDVQPSDWSYQALSNLIEKYGCVAGYPDSSFKGGNALSRYEAAALLNSCLDRVTEVTDELQKLIGEFKTELATLKGRVDGLDKKLGKLEAQQFSTTTKLNGQANFILGGIPGYTYGGANAGNTAFAYDLRLNFDTSYTGQDLLRTRLRTGNFSAQPFSASSGTIFKLDKAEAWNDAVYVDRIYYTFPVGQKKAIKITVGGIVRNTELAWIASAYKSDILDYFSLGGTSGVYNKATGEGVGFQWKQPVPKGKAAWIFNANYVVSGPFTYDAKTKTTSSPAGAGKYGASGADSAYGVFNSFSGINALAQIGYKANNWGAAFGYRYGTENSQVRIGNGPAGTLLGDGQTDNSIAFNAYWQPLKTGVIPSISAGYGYNFVNGLPTTKYKPGQQAQSSRSWVVGLQWDDAFIKGNAAGIALGQPNYANGASQDNPWLVEWFYKYQVSDNISITPALFYASGASNNKDNSNAAGQSSFTGLGGVIQTTFRF